MSPFVLDFFDLKESVFGFFWSKRISFLFCSVCFRF